MNFKKCKNLAQFILEVKVILRKVVLKINLIFQPMYRYFINISGVSNNEYIYFWKSLKVYLMKELILLLRYYIFKSLW